MPNDPAVVLSTTPTNSGPASQGGAGSTTPGPSGPPPEGSASKGNWYDGFSDENKGYAQLKNFKDPQAVLESYRNLEKIHSTPQERILKLPEKADDPAWKDIYKRLGAPEKADGYEVKVPEGMNTEFAEWAKEQFHGLNLTKAQGDKLAAAWNERVQSEMTKHAEAMNDAMLQQEAKIKAEWGAAFEQNKDTVFKIAGAMGMTEEQAQAVSRVIGADTLNRMLLQVATKFGIKFGEDTFRGEGANSGSNNFGQMSPEAARARLSELRNDREWTTRYLNGGAQEAAEMNRLQKNILGERA